MSLSILLSVMALVGSPSEGPSFRGVYQVEPLLPDVALNWPGGLEVSVEDKKFYLLDTARNRILILNTDGVQRQVGHMGQGGGEFLNPIAFSLRRKRLYVVDQGNYRVQILRPEGHLLSSFQINFVSNAISADDDGRIFLNTPELGKVVTMFSRDGEVVKSLGKNLPPSVAYASRPEGPRSLRSYDRAYLQVDASNSLYTIRQFVPLVRKFSIDGTLVWERRLTGEMVAPLVDAFLGKSGARIHSTRSIAGEKAAPEVITASCQTEMGNIAVVLANRGIVVLSASDGEVIAEMSIEAATPTDIYLNVTHHDGIFYFTSISRFYRSQKLPQF